MRDTEIIEWIAYNAARTTDVEELAANDCVRLGAAILGRTSRHVAAEISRVLSRVQEVGRRYEAAKPAPKSALDRMLARKRSR